MGGARKPSAQSPPARFLISTGTTASIIALTTVPVGARASVVPLGVGGVVAVGGAIPIP